MWSYILSIANPDIFILYHSGVTVQGKAFWPKNYFATSNRCRGTKGRYQYIPKRINTHYCHYYQNNIDCIIKYLFSTFLFLHKIIHSFTHYIIDVSSFFLQIQFTVSSNVTLITFWNKPTAAEKPYCDCMIPTLYT